MGTYIAPELVPLLADINTRPAMHETPIAQLRQTRNRIGANDIHPVRQVHDRQIEGSQGHIRLRIYHPFETTATPSVLLFFHGGGFVFGGIDGYYDHVCRVLCDQAHCVVVSVDYRLAPENKFPAATHDAFDALGWAKAHAQELGANPDQVYVSGGSAGANLAASTCLRARDEGVRVDGQVLFYPITRYPDPPTESFLACSSGYYLTGKDILWFWAQYLRSEADRRNPYAAPSQASSYKGLAPAFILTAEADPLRDEGEELARRMTADGVPVHATRFAGMLHGFMSFPTPSAQRALDEAASWITATRASA